MNGSSRSLENGVEVVAETGQRDGVQREPGHVVGHGDIGVRALTVPLVHEAIGHAQHHVEIALHRPLAERRHQDAVGAAPVRLVAVRGEQAVAGHVAQVGERRADDLAEARGVAQLAGQRHGRHERHAPPREVQFEDAVMVPAARQQMLPDLARRDLEQIADDGPARVARNGLEGNGGLDDGHGGGWMERLWERVVTAVDNRRVSGAKSTRGHRACPPIPAPARHPPCV